MKFLVHVLHTHGAEVSISKLNRQEAPIMNIISRRAKSPASVRSSIRNFRLAMKR